jgi:hypothetical protein
MTMADVGNVRRGAVAAMLLVAGSAGAHPAPAAGGAASEPTELVHACWPIDESGALTGTRVRMPVAPEAIARSRAVRASGDNRVDMVFVGDGYTSAQLGTYAAHVNNVVNNFFIYEPFTAYEPYFRITRVDVVSAQSGVDNDPSQGISKNTALDMAYWCSGIERLLCVNVSKAFAAANAWPGLSDIDQIIALANSSKYGGAGYPSSNLGTAAGANSSAVEIAIHEMGHSLGDLADEYDYGGSSTYSGPEPSSKNSSKLTSAQMTAQQSKWWRWLGVSGDPRLDDPVGTFEGSSYSVFGVYRPSSNSMMRSLFRQFNGPSAEELIRQIYLEVDPIDAHTPTGSVLGEADTIEVVPMQPIGHDLVTSWYVDGVLAASLTGQNTVAVADFGLAPGSYAIEAVVVDPTDMVRDPNIRAQFLTSSRLWDVTIVDSACSGIDLTGDGQIDSGDLSAFITAFLAQNPAADLTGDGQVDSGDLSAFITAFLDCL